MSVSLSQAGFPNESNRPGSGWHLGVAHFRGFAITICFLLMTAALGITYLKKTIHNELRNRIVLEINNHLGDSDFRFELGDARWTEGRGLSLTGVKFTDIRTDKVVVEVAEIFASSSFHLTDIFSGKPNIGCLTVDQAVVHFDCSNSGTWNILELGQALKYDDPFCSLDCPVKIRNSTAIVDGKRFGLNQPLSIRGIDCDYAGDINDQERHVIRGNLSSDLSNRVGFDVTIDLGAGIWTATLNADRIDVNERVTSRLPELLSQYPILATIKGQLSIRAGATGRMGDLNSTIFEIVGQAGNVQCLDNSLPHQVHDGAFRFHVDNKDQGIPVLQITEASCGLGYGAAKGSLVLIDPLNQLRWKLTGTVSGFKLTERLVPWLRPDVQRVWHQYQPEGFVDATFDVRFSDGKLYRNIQTIIREGSFSWYRFPFRVSRCKGTIDWIKDEMTIDLTAVESQQSIEIDGKLFDPGLDWSGWLEGKCDGNIPINEKMLQAFDVKPKLARVLRKFNSTGYVNGWGRIERASGSPVVDSKFEFQLHQTTIRHENFDYPIYNIEGKILVDNNKTEFRSFRGMNNNGQIECYGSWAPEQGLKLRFLANNVLLNGELRDALPENLQKTWRGLRPAGTVNLVDVDWQMSPNSGKTTIGVTVDIPQRPDQPSTVAINPVWFPYEMRRVSGKFRFENQRIDIQDFAAQHGRTSINTNGTGAYDDSYWRIRFSDLFANNIVMDESLRKALPPPIAEGLVRTRFEGNLGMRGVMEISGAFGKTPLNANAKKESGIYYVSTTDPKQPTANLDWDLEFGIARAKANIGIPVTNANGVIRLKGRYAGGNVKCSGSLLIDSMMYRGIQVTSVVAPISIDNDRIGFGSLAVSDNPQAKNASATARVFGGYLECDGHVLLAGDNDYFLRAVLTDGNLGDFATETSMQHDFSGKAFAGIQLRGDSTGPHSTRGKGYIQLRNARIYEVPVMLALLNVLRIREPDRTAFDQAQMEFTVNGENFDFQKIEFNGDAISLIGQGTVNLDSEIDMDFYSMVGRNRWRIPVITNLYKAGSKQVWWVEVDGTLENPQTEHQILPGLNDSLKRLFPELIEDDQ